MKIFSGSPALKPKDWMALKTLAAKPALIPKDPWSKIDQSDDLK